MVSPFESDPVLVEVVRNGFIESVHRGRVAITNPDGSLASSVGADFAPMYPRSVNKPLQAVGMVRAGLDLDGELLALVCASHSGESFHLEGVRRILTMSGLDESALQMPADWPLDQQAREDAIRNGVAKSSLAMNCSGKHAGMIRTTILAGGDIANYRDPDHPIQLAIVQAIDDLAHEQATNLAIDGCGAPCTRSRSTPLPALLATSPAHRMVRSSASRRRSGTIRSMCPAPDVMNSSCTVRSQD